MYLAVSLNSPDAYHHRVTADATTPMSMFQCKPGVIVELREKQNFKQEPFAKHIKVSVQTLRKMERGEPVRRDRVLKVAKVLDVAMDELSVVEVEEGEPLEQSNIPTLNIAQPNLSPEDAQYFYYTAYAIDGSDLAMTTRYEIEENLRWFILQDGAAITRDAIKHLRGLEKLIAESCSWGPFGMDESVTGNLSALLDLEEKRLAVEEPIEELRSKHGLHILATRFKYYERFDRDPDNASIRPLEYLALIVAGTQVDEIRVRTLADYNDAVHWAEEMGI